jgi:preprotein translocase subunit SecB
VLLTVAAKAVAGGAQAAGGGEPVFVTELTYAAVVTLREVPQEAVPILLLVETPRLLFPFVRSVIANATREGGFPPLLIHPIDFAELLRRQQTTVPPAGAPGIATA